MASANARKRRRVVELSPTPSLEGDTTAIAPRHTVPGVAQSAQTPLASSRTRGSQTRQKWVAPRAHNSAIPFRSITTQTPLPVNEDNGPVIPENCCYHCLTRGGNAAYECHKEEGEERCERCIRDGKKKCRLPTAEESVAVAARCPQCTWRGFKTCNSEHPCDTCIRNKTEHLCHRPSENKVKLGRPSASRKTIAPSKGPVVDRPSQGRSGNARPPRRMHMNTDKQSIVSSSLISPCAASIAELDVNVDDDNDSFAPGHDKKFARLLTGDAPRGEKTSAGETSKGKLHSNLDKGVHPPLTSSDEVAYTMNPAHVQFFDKDAAIEEATSPRNIVKVGKRASRSRPRVSYIEQPLGNESSNREQELEDDDEDGTPSVSGDESLQIILSEDNHATEEEEEEDAVKSRRKIKGAQSIRTGKGIDLSLPPLSSIEACMSDMTTKALQLGLSEALGHLKERPIKVATMCSGTESPLLALDEISKALQVAGHSPILIQHEFSAEIEVFKQAFIERNFHPKILFRDVRDFICESSTTATTAYGAEVEIPTGIDILVAGFVCKDLSRMNNKGKSLEDGGETGDTWNAVYAYAKRFHPSIVLLENVKAVKATWEDVVGRWDRIGYEAEWVFCDTKNYYLPQTRERMYMVAIKRSHLNKGVTQAVAQWKNLMRKLERQCSSPYEAFLPDSLRESSGYSNLRSEPNWALCKLRNDHIRSEKRLGILSPISRRSDNGTIMPPDFADRDFYNAQSSRVWDAIDIAHLEASQKGYDSLYKMALWDVSQNVDRFKADVGIAPCLTPSGQDFASNRQFALNGSQLLLLQGMPLGRLLFANESQKDLQNLAGNAMSTTVIGASLVAAIISGHKAFQGKETSIHARTSSPQAIDSSLDDTSIGSLLSRRTMEPTTYEQLDLVGLKEEAQSSARLCNCEGKKIKGKAVILTCSACGHSACTSCAGNPKHVYQKATPSKHCTQTPDEFIRRWRPRLPARLKVGFVDVARLASSKQVKDPILSSYIAVISEAQISSQPFCLDEFSREHNLWKIKYSSSNATLELRLGRDTQWLMYVKCPSHLPGNSSLRDFLKNPIAYGVFSETLFDIEWKVRLPNTQNHQLHMSGSAERVSSWRSRLGLPDYKEETVPATMKIHSNVQDLISIIGEYEHLPRCGTACNSLYKRLSGEDNMYLFLDPQPIGRPDHDNFVFSQDHSRKSYGEDRMTVACLDTSWRPWHMDEERERLVATTVSDLWIPTPIKMEPLSITLDVGYLEGSNLDEQALQGCSRLLPVLDVFVHESLSNRAFPGYSWALERARLLPLCSSWYQVRSPISQECSCAPKYPTLLWSVDEKGVATAHEDRQAAAAFERALKMRPEIFRLTASSDSTQARIQIGINIMSLVHRAQGRLPGHSSVSTSWRLLTDHSDLPSQPFARFRLRSNANDITPTHQITAAPKYLLGSQMKSLVWMATQELGTRMTISETEESVHSELGWRVEARAETEVCVRGGVLADQPSFGKTVTTIALIQSEFDQYTPEVLIRRNQSLALGLPRLLESAATLVVCPSHIALQWRTELEKFLDKDQFQLYNVAVIENFTQLKELTIENLLRSRVIVVAWDLFFDKEYVSELANFTAMPEPTLVSRRAFDAWMTRATTEIPSQLVAYQTHAYEEFQRRTKDLIESRLQHPDFKATIPIRIQYGRAYESYSTIQSCARTTNASKAKGKVATKPKPSTRTRLMPLIHLFRFNRVVIDEYHYLNDSAKVENAIKATAVKAVGSHKRWILSGTPALESFSDVNQIASFLGIRLGRYFVGDGTVAAGKKTPKLDQTDVESFLSQTEIMSRQWHDARHQRAQEFLDKFVRQNEAELQGISCTERLVPVKLDAAHHAVYLELSQHLISQRMQIKKLNSKSSSDRNDRLNDSLDNSSTAEEALLKSALVFEAAEDGKSGLELLITKRSEQLESTRDDLRNLLMRFEHLMRVERRAQCEKKASGEASIVELYGHFKNDIAQDNCLGDEDASQGVRDLLVEAKKSPNLCFSQLKGKDERTRLQMVKKLLSQLRDLCLELTHRTRSRRFIASIQDHLQPPTRETLYSCSSPSCNGVADADELFSIPHCGHTACQRCLETRTDDETCVHTSCKARANEGNLIPMTNLSPNENEAAGQTFGKKLSAIVRLVSKMSVADQGILFAPNEETITIIEDVLDRHKISYYSTRNRRTAPKAIESFKANKKPGSQKKLLILNLGSESAAGVNLTNANHVIFVSPFHTKKQYNYDSAMAQAIARSRRFGQKKMVHIYHVVALRTIDVDILEHHHKRCEAMISAPSQSDRMWPELCMKKEKTRLVKEKQGEMMLVPCSWLEDEQKRDLIDVGNAPERFTSLINLSVTFDQDDDDD